MLEMFSYTFIKNAFLAGILASIACGIIGSIVVSKRIVSLCGGIAHASFGGVGLGYLLRFNPSIGALLFGIVSSLGIGSVSKKAKQTEDTAIAIFWAVGMSLGILFISLARGYAPDLFTYLFGNILAVSPFDLCSLLILDIVIAAGYLLFYKETVALCFDEEFARVRGIKTFALYLGILFIVATAVVILMKIVGIILVIALLSLPAAAAGKFTRTLKQMMWLSVLLSMLFISAGIFLSYVSDLPSGATIILFAAGMFVASEGFLRIRRAARRRANRQ